MDSSNETIFSPYFGKLNVLEGCTTHTPEQFICCSYLHWPKSFNFIPEPNTTHPNPKPETNIKPNCKPNPNPIQHFKMKYSQERRMSDHHSEVVHTSGSFTHGATWCKEIPLALDSTFFKSSRLAQYNKMSTISGREIKSSNLQNYYHILQEPENDTAVDQILTNIRATITVSQVNDPILNDIVIFNMNFRQPWTQV